MVEEGGFFPDLANSNAVEEKRVRQAETCQCQTK